MVSEKVYLLIIICNGFPCLGIRNRQTDNPNTLGYLHSRQDDIQISFGVHFQIKTAYSLNLNGLRISNQTYLPPRRDINPVVHISRVVGDVIRYGKPKPNYQRALIHPRQSHDVTN